MYEAYFNSSFWLAFQFLDLKTVVNVEGERKKHFPSLPGFAGMLHVVSMLILLSSIIIQENLKCI